MLITFSFSIKNKLYNYCISLDNKTMIETQNDFYFPQK